MLTLVGTFIDARWRQNPQRCPLESCVQPHILSKWIGSFSSSAPCHWSWVVSGWTVLTSFYSASRSERRQWRIWSRTTEGQLQRAVGLWCCYLPKQSSLLVNAAPNIHTYTHTHKHQSPLQSLYSPCERLVCQMKRARASGRGQIGHTEQLWKERGLWHNKLPSEGGRGQALVKEEGRRLQVGGSVNVLYWGNKRFLFVCVCLCKCVCQHGVLYNACGVEAHIQRGVHLCNGEQVCVVHEPSHQVVLFEIELQDGVFDSCKHKADVLSVCSTCEVRVDDLVAVWV